MNKLENVKLLYSNNYWDGPISGLCEYEGIYYYFNQSKEDMWDEVKEEWLPREYKVYEILPWQLAYELYWHSLFITNVKNARCDSTFEKKLKNDIFKIKEDYYKKRKKEYKEINYSKNKVIGIFTY